MNEVKLDMLVETFTCGFGRVVEITYCCFVAHFEGVLSENKERIFNKEDIIKGRVKLHPNE